MGRLHTCYSPVRRSPAVNGKPSTPLPLDLHVLSLSLAFILSQDQTLRCYIFFFFLSIKKSKTLKFVLLRTIFTKRFLTNPLDPAPFRTNRLLCLFSKLTESIILLLYYFVSIVNLSMFVLVLRGFQPESGYKVTTFCNTHQIFGKFLTNFYILTLEVLKP